MALKVYITVSHFQWDCVNVFGNRAPWIENEKGKSEINEYRAKKDLMLTKETFILFLVLKDWELLDV